MKAEFIGTLMEADFLGTLQVELHNCDSKDGETVTLGQVLSDPTVRSHFVNQKEDTKITDDSIVLKFGRFYAVVKGSEEDLKKPRNDVQIDVYYDINSKYSPLLQSTEKNECEDKMEKICNQRESVNKVLSSGEGGKTTFLYINQADGDNWRSNTFAALKIGRFYAVINGGEPQKDRLLSLLRTLYNMGLCLYKEIKHTFLGEEKEFDTYIKGLINELTKK